ncbi:MAG: hypothetical protein QNJ68_03360 [Microcoleaceae cyanobacterium MO_207.B10]|nr:hypothetical protein [Microcoleaceae cyanobacterium MO_207.B10]
MIIIRPFKKLAFISFASICLSFALEYPSFSKNSYTRNQNQAHGKNEKADTFKLNKPTSAKNKNLSLNKEMKGNVEISEDGCISKILRLRNGMNIKIKQGCN